MSVEGSIILDENLITTINGCSHKTGRTKKEAYQFFSNDNNLFIAYVIRKNITIYRVQEKQENFPLSASS